MSVTSIVMDYSLTLRLVVPFAPHPANTHTTRPLFITYRLCFDLRSFPPQIAPAIREECEKNECSEPAKHFKHCAEKVEAGKGWHGEDCVEELFHLMHCVDVSHGCHVDSTPESHPDCSTAPPPRSSRSSPNRPKIVDRYSMNHPDPAYTFSHQTFPCICGTVCFARTNGSHHRHRPRGRLQ